MGETDLLNACFARSKPFFAKDTRCVPKKKIPFWRRFLRPLSSTKKLICLPERATFPCADDHRAAVTPRSRIAPPMSQQAVRTRKGRKPVLKTAKGESYHQPPGISPRRTAPTPALPTRCPCSARYASPRTHQGGGSGRPIGDKVLTPPSSKFQK